MGNDKMCRVAENFIKELEEIQIERLKLGLDNKIISAEKITGMLPKHTHWRLLKEDLIKFDGFNKK